MNEVKKELAVAALENGTVIDHLPCSAVYKAVRILGIEDMHNSVTIGNNLASGRLGRKGIIKVADVEFDDTVLNRIAVFAPTAVVNTIRNYRVASKKPVSLPDVLVGVVHCSNPKCITNNEPMKTSFEVIDRDNVTLRCRYCNRTVSGPDAEIL
ncbi:MAG: aspartate carbamoyltransferase regulatory subunit [Muribaculaceae bacterium]|nr:aspartate carbamoyltransferase regulatory subunit [Muribaculaceae bacterium]